MPDLGSLGQGASPSMATGALPPVTLIVAIHGIGFAKPGSLAPALAQLKGTDTDVLIDANWNDIAGAGHNGALSGDQFGRLCRAIDTTARLRPPGGRVGLWNACIEAALDLADFYFTLALWAAGPAIVVAVMLNFTHVQPSPLPLPPWRLIARAYLAGYFVLAALSLPALTLALFLRAPRFTAQAAHLLLLAVRPFWILSFLWMLTTRFRLSPGTGVFTLIGVEITGFLAWACAGLIQDHGFGYTLAGGLVALYLLSPIVTAMFFAPALKLAEDVLLYVSDAAYRDQIQAALADKIERARPPGRATNLVIVGHSLGSVIAADLLVNHAFGPAYERFTLVTVGSPIRRLFQTFLPGHLLPARIDGIVSAVAAKGPFAWYNYYRRFDGVGAKLGLPEREGFREARSPIVKGPLSSHIGYWREPGFFDFVAECRGLGART
jgi:hypothetical protein